MDLNELERLLAAYKSGELQIAEAAQHIRNLHYEDVGYARVDHSRATRQGFPEVVFGVGKTRAQVVGIVERLVQRSPNVPCSRELALSSLRPGWKERCRRLWGAL